MIIISPAIKHHPGLGSFLSADSNEEILRLSHSLAPFYSGVAFPSDVRLTPLEIAALLNKTQHVIALLSQPLPAIGQHPEVIGVLLGEENETDSELSNYLLPIAKLFTDAKQLIALNKSSSEAATLLIKHKESCIWLTNLFDKAEQFVDLAKGSSWASQWMILNKECWPKILQLFQTPEAFARLAPYGGPIRCLLGNDEACQWIAGLYRSAEEYLSLARVSEPLRSASAMLALNEQSGESIANLFTCAEEFIQLTAISPLTTQYLSIKKESCVIIAKLFKNPEQFTCLVNTKNIAPYYLTLYEESSAILGRLYTNPKQLQLLDITISECHFNCPPNHYSQSLSKFLSPQAKRPFFNSQKNTDPISENEHESGLEI